MRGNAVSLFLRRFCLILAALLCLPVLLFVYQPAWRLGGFGFALGAIGMTLSPLILFGCVVFTIKSLWR